MSDTLESRIAALERAVNTHETLEGERARRLEELRPKRVSCEQESKKRFGVLIKDLVAWAETETTTLSAEVDEVKARIDAAQAEGS